MMVGDVEEMPVKSGLKQGSKYSNSTSFKPGQSGNPAGQSQGSRHKTTLMLEKLLEGQAEEIHQSIVRAAMDRDPTAMRLLYERLVPLRRGRPVEFTAPKLETLQDVSNAYDAVIHLCSISKLSLEEGAALKELLLGKQKVLEAQMQQKVGADGATVFRIIGGLPRLGVDVGVNGGFHEDVEGSDAAEAQT